MKKLFVTIVLFVLHYSLFAAGCDSPTLTVTPIDFSSKVKVTLAYQGILDSPSLRSYTFDYSYDQSKEVTNDYNDYYFEIYDTGKYTFELSYWCTASNQYEYVYKEYTKVTKSEPYLPHDIKAIYNKQDKKIDLSWKYEGSGSAQFEVYRYDGNDGSTSLISSRFPETSYSDNSIALGNYYAYYIKVFNEPGDELATSTEDVSVNISACDAFIEVLPQLAVKSTASLVDVEFIIHPIGAVDSFSWYVNGNMLVESKDFQMPITYSYPNPGPYTENITVYNTSDNCWYNFNQEIQVGNYVPVTANFDYQIDNKNLSLTITDLSAQGATRKYYTYGDGTGPTIEPLHTYLNSGWYSVCQHTSNGDGTITDEMCKYIQVGTLDCYANVSFYAYNTSDNIVSFTNYSATGTYLWSFGDGTISTDYNVEHSYKKAGIYQVQLEVYDTTLNCKAKYTQETSVGQQICMADFDYWVNIDTREVSFDSKSTGAAYYYWSLDNGVYDVAPNTTQKYPYNGRFIVSLSITNSTQTCSDYIQKEIQVGELPCNAVYSYSAIAGTNEVQFKSKATAPNTDYYWDLGDGNYTNVTNPKYSYKNEGYYTVGLYTYNSETNCNDSYYETIIVGSPADDCEAYFYYQADETNENFLFTDASYGIDIVKRVWNFGDGTTLSSEYDTISHYYAKPGYYNVCLTIVSASGAANITCYDVYAGFDPASNCLAKMSTVVDDLNKTVKFIDKSRGDNINSYSWYFGDDKGIIGTSADTAYMYDNPNYYVIWHNITTESGCSSWAYDYINVGMPDEYSCRFIAKVNESIALKATGYPVDFVGVGMGDNARLKWDFGDGESDTTTNSPTHYYTDGLDVHQVCYTVSDPITEETATYCSYIDKNGNEVGIDKNTQKAMNNAMIVSPNPFAGQLRIAATTSLGGNYVVSVTDITGRVLQQIKASTMAGNFDVNINTSAIENGTYIVKITTPDNKSFNRVVVKK